MLFKWTLNVTRPSPLRHDLKTRLVLVLNSFTSPDADSSGGVTSLDSGIS